MKQLKKPMVSVIMPVRNEERFIADTVAQVLDQELDDVELEVLVADGRSDDRTREIVSEIAEQRDDVRLLDNAKNLSSAARNVGIENAKGEYIVVVDGHCEIPSRTYFKDVMRAFERTGADCLGRPQPLVVDDASHLQKAIAQARNSRLGHHPASYIYSNKELEVPAISVAVAYRRRVFDRIGQFDPAFDACEDCELNYRIDKAGMKCYLIPELSVRYKPRDSLRGLFRQLMRYGRGRVRMFRKHRESFSIASVIPGLFLAGLTVGPLLCLVFPVLWYLYLGVLAIYVATVLVFSIQIAVSEADPSLLIWLPLVFVVIHLGSGWGVLVETFTGRRLN